MSSSTPTTEVYYAWRVLNEHGHYVVPEALEIDDADLIYDSREAALAERDDLGVQDDWVLVRQTVVPATQDNERYIVVTHGGGEDFHYMLLKAAIWEEYLAQFRMDTYHNVESVMDAMINRVIGYERYDQMTASTDPDEDILLFCECAVLFAFVEQHNLRVVGGRN